MHVVDETYSQRTYNQVPLNGRPIDAVTYASSRELPQLAAAQVRPGLLVLAIRNKRCSMKAGSMKRAAGHALGVF